MSTETKAQTPSGRWVKVIRELPFEEYTALPGANSSRLKHLKHSPKKYKENPQEVGTKSLSVGSMAHTMLLEPNEVGYRYALPPSDVGDDKRKKAYKEWAATMPDTVEMPNLKDFEKAGDIVESIENDPLCIEHLDGGVTELTIQWQDEETGVLCKARLDHLGANGITDLKTTQDPTPDGFPWEAKRYGYFNQAAHYRAGVRAANAAGLLDHKDDYFLLAAENTGALFCQVLYQLSAEELDSFDAVRLDDLATVQKCEETGEWPSPGLGAVNMLSYPTYKPATTDDSDDATEGQGYE